MSKLCILGEDAEPCFEGSQITKVQFSFEDGFKDQLTQMIKELTNFLNKEGGTKLFNRFAVEIGDALWDSLHSFLRNSYPDPEDEWCSVYSIEGIYEEEGQKFAILRNRQNAKYYRLDFSVSEDEGFVPATEFVEVTKEYVPAAESQFSEEAVKAYELQFKEQEKEEEKPEDEEEKPEDEEEKPEDKEEEDEDNKKKTYSVEEYEELESKFSALQEEKDSLEKQLESLIEFKNQIEREKKEEMINSFYMLSDEDKKDVVENIDKYSLNEIEAKLSIICVRNKVSFDLEEESAEGKEKESIVFTLDDNDPDETTPAWVKAALDVAKNME